MKPPVLSILSTTISTSLCKHKLEVKAAASIPKGSDFSDGFLAVLGVRIPESTKVSLRSCLGTNTLNLEPLATKSTTAALLPALLNPAKYPVALAAVSLASIILPTRKSLPE